MRACRFGLTAVTLWVLALARGCQTLTFQAIDAETKAPLANRIRRANPS